MKIHSKVIGVICFPCIAFSLNQDLTGSEKSGNSSLDLVGEVLAARSSEFVNCSIHFVEWSITCTDHELSKILDSLEQLTQDELTAERVEKTLSSANIQNFRRSGMYTQGDGALGFSAEVQETFGDLNERLEQMAREQGITEVRGGITDDLVLVENEVFHYVQGDEQLVIGGRQILPMLMFNLQSFDMSLGPWKSMVIEGALPGQTISADVIETGAALIFESDGSGVEYHFDPENSWMATEVRDFNPEGVATIRQRFFGEIFPSGGAVELPMRRVAVLARRRAEDLFGVTVLYVREVSLESSVTELKSRVSSFEGDIDDRRFQ